MSLFEAIRKRGIFYHPTEEDLFAEAFRESQSGVRRDGLWARALSECDMDPEKAKATYFRMRVQTLREESSKLIAELLQTESEAIKKRESDAAALVIAAEQQVIRVLDESKGTIDKANAEAKASTDSLLERVTSAETANRELGSELLGARRELDEAISGRAQARLEASSYRAKWLTLLFAVIAAVAVAGVSMYSGHLKLHIG
jgi:hypothetical protein